jgi:serine protease
MRNVAQFGGTLPTEGRSGVPLRFLRPVIPVVATGMAALWVVAGSAPAIADQVRQQEWWLGALDVTQAQQVSQGSGITVAVLGDGVDAQAPDLGGSVTVGPDFTGTGAGAGPQATAAASLIAGHGNGPGGGSGVLGIAPRARILSVRVTLDPSSTALDSSAEGASLPGAIASGIRYAVAHHATIIDLPADPGRPDPAQIAALPVPQFATEPPQLAGIDAAQGGSQAEQQAVQFALSKGVVLVAPAGDDNQGGNAVNFPASYPGVISVGAFDDTFTMAPFSAAQSYVTLTAGGVNVIADADGGGYTTVSSTSAASAMVAGMAALIRAQYPSLTPAQVRAALTTSTAIKPRPGAPAGSGAGSADAARAMLAAASLAAPPSARAGASAQPATSPAPPVAVPVSSDSVVPGLVRSVAISAGLLVVLLAVVFWNASMGRRKARASARATAAWARSTQNPFSAYESTGDTRTEADRMLEYFAAPSSDPRAAASARSPGPATGPHMAGSRTGGDSVSSGVGAWAPVTPATRAQARQTRVSGAPPWEPASEPSSELPWAVPGPAASPNGGSHPAAPAADSIWPVPAQQPADAVARSWDELAASTRSGSIPSGSIPSGSAGRGDDLAALGEDAGRVPGSGEPAAPVPFPAGSPWEPATPPPRTPSRSPSGSGWEAFGEDEPGGSDDAYRSSPPGEEAWHAAPVTAPWPDTGDDTHWQPTDGGGRWSPPADPWQPREAPASSAPWERPSAAGTWDAPDPAEPAAPDDMLGWRPAENGPDES